MHLKPTDCGRWVKSPRGTLTHGPLSVGLSWNDALRGLELDDATRRSIERRRCSTLEYQEVSEEATFKGTMTLVGCSIFWVSLVLLILSIWIPWLGWIIAPALGLFLAFQLLRWVALKPRAQEPPRST